MKSSPNRKAVFADLSTMSISKAQKKNSEEPKKHGPWTRAPSGPLHFVVNMSKGWLPHLLDVGLPCRQCSFGFRVGFVSQCCSFGFSFKHHPAKNIASARKLPNSVSGHWLPSDAELWKGAGPHEVRSIGPRAYGLKVSCALNSHEEQLLCLLVEKNALHQGVFRQANFPELRNVCQGILCATVFFDVF